MALTKEFEYDCEVRGPYKAVQVRQSTVIKDDGVEISRNYHRHVLQCRTKTGDTWGDTDSIWERVEREALEGEWYAEHVDMEEDYFDDEDDDSES